MTALAPGRTQSHKHEALEQAIDLAARDLRGVDMDRRCEDLGLGLPASGCLVFMLLGREVRMRLVDFTAQYAASGRNLHPVEHLITLHYLGYTQPLCQPEDWISYRQFPGGAFYWQPFRDRSVLPLVAEFGNNLNSLRARLERFDWHEHDAGDLGAEIHVLGRARLLLVYHAADEEFPASAELLFSANLVRVFCAEDAAALAGRLCAGLRKHPCKPCRACGMCDMKHKT